MPGLRSRLFFFYYVDFFLRFVLVVSSAAFGDGDRQSDAGLVFR